MRQAVKGTWNAETNSPYANSGKATIITAPTRTPNTTPIRNVKVFIMLSPSVYASSPAIAHLADNNLTEPINYRSTTERLFDGWIDQNSRTTETNRANKIAASWRRSWKRGSLIPTRSLSRCHANGKAFDEGGNSRFAPMIPKDWLLLVLLQPLTGKSLCGLRVVLFLLSQHQSS